jgi:lipoprotein-anchoring transpeptidase ErfK/SrfK
MRRVVTPSGYMLCALVALGPMIGSALGQPLAMTSPGVQPAMLFEPQLREQEAEPPSDSAQLPAHLRRQVVNYDTREAAGTIVIDTANTHLYYVLGHGRAIRYGIGVGRDGFRWSGVEKVSRMAEWPDWHPPAEMIGRQPYLPRFMAGGESNPLGARALYLGSSTYRIHGTNAPSTIGKRVSSGCIRLHNDDVVDLYKRVHTGTKVVVLAGSQRQATAPAVAPAAVRASAPAPMPPAATIAEPVRPFATMVRERSDASSAFRLY